jgi:hypothetical protein
MRSKGRHKRDSRRASDALVLGTCAMERLFSVEARLGWVELDLRALPGVALKPE